MILILKIVKCCNFFIFAWLFTWEQRSFPSKKRPCTFHLNHGLIILGASLFLYWKKQWLFNKCCVTYLRNTLLHWKLCVCSLRATMMAFLPECDSCNVSAELCDADTVLEWLKYIMELNHCDKAGLFPGLGVCSVFNTEKVRRFVSYPEKPVFKNSTYGEGSYQIPTHSPVGLWCSFFGKDNIYLFKRTGSSCSAAT